LICLSSVASAASNLIITGCGATDPNLNYGLNVYPVCCPMNLPKYDGVTCVAGQSTTQFMANPYAAVPAATPMGGVLGGQDNNTLNTLGGIMFLIGIGLIYFYVEKKK